MTTHQRRALELLKEFKGNHYRFGMDVLPQIGPQTHSLGRRTVLIRSTFSGSQTYVDTLAHMLKEQGISCEAIIKGPAPNAPIEDLLRITAELDQANPDFVISFGGGSVIDTAKAAIVLHSFGGEIENYFGTGKVTAALQANDKTLIPHLAIQTAASSAAHLTKYSNITNLQTGQKKLIVDEAIVPTLAVFDYATTLTTPDSLTGDGAMDGISHALEVLYGAISSANYSQIEEVSLTAIALIVNALPVVLAQPNHRDARTNLALGTDLGGYAIMLGGTNGGHLTSFSLVDLLPHGRACGLLNPYYSIYFAPAIQEPLHKVGQIYKQAGFSSDNFEQLEGYPLGSAVAKAMIAFNRKMGLPTTLNEIEGFNNQHIQRALSAAKNPQLKMKLENMPIPMTLEKIDTDMRAILEAAATGDFAHILKTV